MSYQFFDFAHGHSADIHSRSDTKPVLPSLDKYPRCIKKLQADFTFHTDISSVPKMADYRSKARLSFAFNDRIDFQAAKVITNVVKYFDIPDVKNIDLDDVSSIVLHAWV